MSFPHLRNTTFAAGAVLALSAVLLSPAGAASAVESLADPLPPQHLDLGAPDLPETRTTSSLAPGVTLTRISRGGADASLSWTAEVIIPGAVPSPLAGRPEADAVAAKLAAAGIQAEVQQVDSPQLADAGGQLGYRVRAGRFASKTDGTALKAQIKAAGYSSNIIYTGWDGDSETIGSSRGPWNLEVITIDPRQYRGELSASFGPDLERPETTSQLSGEAKALAAVNAGFFVFDPAAGAPGDPAGIGIYNGRLLREPVGDRPALVLDGNSNRSSITRLTWKGTLSGPGATLELSGINRTPGLMRNCGEKGGLPTWLPLHDVTCTDPNELVAFTPDFGAKTPTGPGLEVSLDEQGTVSAVAEARGAAVPAGGHTIQATGSQIDQLRAMARIGSKLRVTAKAVGPDGQDLGLGKGTDVVNGAPLLVKDGQEDVTVRRDGMVHPNDGNSFYYGWVHKRNPRTFAGTDAQGRTILVTADGRSTASLGLGLKEEANVAKSLGMVQAMNLDGGGSTTAVVGSSVVNTPSGAAERPVGDAILVLPARRGGSGGQ